MARALKNGRLEEEHVTPIEAHSPVKIIEPTHGEWRPLCSLVARPLSGVLSLFHVAKSWVGAWE